MKKIILWVDICLILATFLLAVFIQKGALIKSPAISILDSPVTKKVMVINFNPIIENKNSRPLNEVLSWNDPHTLSAQYIDDVKIVSNDYLRYQIVNWEDVDDFPQLADGFDYSDNTWFNCWNNHNNCHNPWLVDYNKILADFQVCDKVNQGQVDELWLWGGPWFGFYEAIMAGVGAFWTNAPPLISSSCNSQLHIMGFSYERGNSEMLEDLGHRVEGTIKHLYGSWSSVTETHDWDKFTLYDKIKPGKAACGNVHYAPNSLADYDWSNSRYVNSSCEDWLNYPNLTRVANEVNCSTWDCNGYGWKKYWLGHLPKNPGRTNNKWNNWWYYIADYEEALKVPPSPSATPETPIEPSSTPTPTPFSFSPSPSVSPELTASPTTPLVASPAATLPTNLWGKITFFFSTLISWLKTVIQKIGGGRLGQ